MKKLISYQLVDYLERRGIEHVFGLCGHTVIAMLDALKDSKLNFVSVRHEQVAAHAADAYARITQKASVVLCHLGPGLTNAVTGVATASLDAVPMVVIAGDVPSYYYGKHPHQEINMHCDGSQYDIYKPFVKRAWRIDVPELFPEILDKAFRLAESGRPGPVLISVPMDMFSRELDPVHFERTYHDSHTTVRPALPKETAVEIAKMLIEAKNPVIHGGGQLIYTNASEELIELVEFLDIPVTRTLMAQGAIPDNHPLHVGMTGFWGTNFVNEVSTRADVILGVGTRFAEADSSSWYKGVSFNIPPTKLIQIDLDPIEIGRNYPVALGAVADPKQALKAILEAAKELKPEGIDRPELRKAIADYRAAFKASNVAISEDNRFPMTPQRILKDVREVLPQDAIIATDVGWNKNGVSQQFEITQPGTILHTGGLATMGFGPAAILGAKLAAPDKKVITLVGDGGFGTNPTVMATAVEQNIPVVWVVMNNGAFGTIAGLEAAQYHHSFGTIFKKPDGTPYNPEWAEVAKAYGIKSKKITSAEEFKAAFKEALDSNEPYLLDVPMENIPVPTDGIWNINDIYTPKENVAEGRLVYGEATRSKHVATK
ncbi:acetolactate synthase-1/2/3 large subunit [Anaerosolibacter carboniphilus]|uniref:Acetolactate synthase-1/2/3 large subunit n=1 Tax=Anaerosolibacter carboniphilus TaxID=1417629 RepID=A0A841KSY7_9FIRM|nr:thiamine pyrophosphate-binding protein [Anaerosolibacter carboniphilus]MBB6215268.1 acetolactate synthase-1/2/3 large subunit [Anaerosolibacter carboniphilus]